jgi:fatty acid desaturase
MTYSRDDFELPDGFLRRATTLKPLRSFFAIVYAWAGLIAAVLFSRHFVWKEGVLWLYPICLFLIAGRQGVLLQLLHECSHRLISSSRQVNLLVARWLCAYPIGLSADGYIKAHLTHHGNANTEKDPWSDREKYRETDFSRLPVYLLLVKDLLGITALQIFFLYREYSEKKEENKIQTLAFTSLVQLLLISFLFELDLRQYILDRSGGKCTHVLDAD